MAGGTARGLSDEAGTTLIELLVVSALLIVVVGATLAFLEFGSRTQQRDAAYGQEVASTQTALSQLIRDLRQARKIVAASPNSIEYWLPATGGATYDVKYDCTQTDTLGAGYTRCARVQSTVPAALPAFPSTPSSLDVQHIENGTITSFCTGDGSNPSGSVFFFADPSNPDTNASPPACDETYQLSLASLNPAYVKVLVKVPASGDLNPKLGLKHATELSVGAFVQNRGYGL